MWICFATETAAWELSPLLPTIFGGVIGWFLKVLADRMSEKRLFDHRIRLEKEYGLYSDLWDKLFELRRAVGQLVEPLSSTSEVRHDERTLELFNAYQATVRKGEPFMSASIFVHARKIATIARTIIGNVGKQQSLSERCAEEPNPKAHDQRLATKRHNLDKENETAFKDVSNRCDSYSSPREPVGSSGLSRLQHS